MRRRLRRELGPGPILVCPGIRLGGDRPDDQKRVVTPYRAVRDGADYLVVGTAHPRTPPTPWRKPGRS